MEFQRKGQIALVAQEKWKIAIGFGGQDAYEKEECHSLPYYSKTFSYLTLTLFIVFDRRFCLR